MPRRVKPRTSIKTIASSLGLHESVATYKEPTDGEPLWTDRNDKEKVKNEWASERAAIISLLLLTRKILYCTNPREVSFLWVIKVW